MTPAVLRLDSNLSLWGNWVILNTILSGRRGDSLLILITLEFD